MKVESGVFDRNRPDLREAQSPFLGHFSAATSKMLSDELPMGNATFNSQPFNFLRLQLQESEKCPLIRIHREAIWSEANL